MPLEPTAEQSVILSHARTDESLLINALAGAAKTTTLVMLGGRLPLEPTLCLAFNKRIADEMAKRMPSHINCATLNSAGHRAWSSTIGKRLRVDTDKSYSILSEYNGRLSPEDRKSAGEVFAATLRALRLAKSAGYVPESMRRHGRSLCDVEVLIEAVTQQIDLDLTDEQLLCIDKCLETSIAQSYDGVIDFDDQIYMSTLFGGNYPKYPIIMVDEAQDLSPLNHESLKKMYGRRIIAVGDPNQAIYAFRGASHTSMKDLKSAFSMTELTLSTSFRCPRAVISNVHWHVPHMTWPEWAKDGAVERLDTWTAHTIPDGAAIICRNNAPVFKAALRLIRAGRSVKILGNDIGANLVRTLEKLGPTTMVREELFVAIDAWRADGLAKAKVEAQKDRILDRAECLMVFAEVGQTLAESIAYAKTLFSQEGLILLMTGHKSKGGEWPIIFHLDPWLVPNRKVRERAEATGDESQLIQEKNLKYVIDTRAQESLYYINSEDYE